MSYEKPTPMKLNNIKIDEIICTLLYFVGTNEF
jgi:hypothetical protein